MSTEPPSSQPQRPQLSVQTRNPNQQTVFARLQGLFPNTNPGSGSGISANNDPGSSDKRPGSSQRSVNLPKSLKIRLLTWNMHDSVPKGDLEMLFGKAPFYTPTPDTGSLPQFPSEPDHPYHLIVVAGQECPSTSGIPMGLGAGFKRYDKDKDKDKDKDDREKDRPSKHSNKEETIRSKKSYEDMHHDSTPSGWTSMTEDWLCHGGTAAKSVSPAPSDISIPKPLSPRLISKEPKRGPYQLLCKERLLGIYLAIYVHRDVKKFVRGTSKSTVTSGLMGGRWGNKGGVGISVNIDGKTFLFLNCHLAAQVDKANLHDRLNNYNKIKAELAVEDFLTNNDPRVMSEDITDKFDHTFVLGDLNFRLDISRLHADWLISRQDYAQALAFDQLRSLMENGRAFVGFQEGPINFPPTFKYDVLRTLKGSKRRQVKLERWKSDRAQRLTEVSEKDAGEAIEVVDTEEADKSSDDADGEGEAASVASSVWTSTHSRHRTDGDQDDEVPRIPGLSRSSSSKLSLTVHVAAQKAKTKWLSLMSPTGNPASPTKWLRSKSSLVESIQTPRTHRRSHSGDMDPDPGHQPYARSADGSPDLPGDATLLPPPSLGRVGSTKSSVQSDDEDGEERGVYDTSHKKRVPSWCDRILYKSTVEPDPDPEHEELLRPRNRVGQFFANAFRPLSTRSRRNSIASVSTSGASSTATPAQSSNESPLPSPDLLENIIPFSRFVYPDSRASTEHLANDTPHESDGHHPSPIPSPDVSKRASATSVIPSSDSPLRDHIPAASRWRFLQSFLTHNPSGSISSDNSTNAPSSIRIPRKGDVVCLSYDTLDDRSMRRLEGRSDHRPVVGSYAVYM
ncbi:hypothetical protein V5O48_008557 [Marasmius crinis-equi]|uniref:Inositol polyphosphate-related phosphatase domain-containing protein n=1 Tax=Marasmius crinis-equi TaxID=585013 RepID=A0ABR3FDT7_9AGAR